MKNYLSNFSLKCQEITFSTWLTIVRIVSIPWLVKAILFHEWRVALFLLICAAITDILDGFLARLWLQQTTLGALLDPVADKLLTVSCFAAVSHVGLIPGWFFKLSVVKEVVQVLGASLLYAATGGKAKSANFLGKLAMVGQVIIIGWLLISAAFKVVPSPYLVGTMSIVALLMILSLLVYVYQELNGGQRCI